MLKDVTIGQYYPTNSVIHNLDPRTKIIFTFIYIISLFLITNFIGYAVAFGFLLTIIVLSKIPFSYILKGLKGLIIIIILTVVINMFMTPGNALVKFGVFVITEEGLRLAVFMALRLILLIMGTSIMTLSTSPIVLTDGIEYCMKVIPFVKKYAHELSMMMTIALRFIPTLMEETDKIMKAQMARGADFESGNIIKRAKSLVPLLVPLFISAFRRADELAIAMEARCYRGGENRTRLKELKYYRRDFIAYMVTLIMVVGIIGTRYL